MEKHGYNEYFGEECVEWFVNEMLKTEPYMKQFFEKKIDIKPITIPIYYKKDSCWLCEKQFENEQETATLVVNYHSQLTGKFRGLAHDKCNSNTKKMFHSYHTLSITFVDLIVIYFLKKHLILPLKKVLN